MEERRVIKFKKLGIVSVAMDPQKPITKFDLALEKAVPAGKIYQLAVFNKENTKFELLDDIVREKRYVVIFDITPNTYYLKLNGENANRLGVNEINSVELLNGRFCVGTRRVNCGGLEKSLILKNLDVRPENDTTLDLKFLAKNNERFVKNQIKMLNKQLKKESKVLEPEF